MAPPRPDRQPARSGLATRVVVGIGLIALACAALWAGGIAFTALAAAAVLLMFAEWCVMHNIGRGFRLFGLAALAGAVALVANGPAGQAVAVLAAAAGVLGLFARSYGRQRAFWLASGLLYCGLPGIALIWLRQQHPTGFGLATMVLVIVWATDIAAFFTGRALGGPKLAPSISPNKTLAGLAGGVAAAAVVATLAARPLGLTFASPVIFAILGALLAFVAQGGDLFESWLKRRVGVKDSGTLLPGHGGVLDRLDGLVPVAVIAALVVAVLK